MKTHRLLTLPLLLCTLAACSPDIQSHGNILEGRTAIIGGEAVNERLTEASRSVVVIEMVNSSGSPFGFCTATLIGTNTVLTAGHCFDKKRMPALAGFNVLFTNKYVFFQHYPQRKGLRHLIHTDYNSSGDYDHDLAVASFEGSLPEGYKPVAIDTDKDTDHSGGTVYVYGYGRAKDYTGRPTQDMLAEIGQLHRGVMKIDEQFNRFADRYWTTKEVPVFICQGDSGGPQFYHENGVLKVMGVNSAVYGPRLPNGRSSCKGIAQATKVAPFAPWIQSSRRALFSEDRSVEWALSRDER